MMNDIDVKKEFSTRLKKARKERNLTQQELSNNSGIAIGSIAQMETGARLPSAETLVKLAQSMKVSTDFLLGMPDYGIYFDKLTSEQTKTIEWLVWHFLNVNNGIENETVFNLLQGKTND